ncbi:hypothetical protein K8T06_16550, partial [bacterium]|nr:hypothetical protein [bacterium]
MAANLKILETRAKIIRAIRTFFVQQDFLEVETPVLVPSPGMEPHLEPFETLFIPEGSNRSDCPDNSMQPDNSIQLYLPTSPEFYMKRLLCQGCNRIFQICRAFRNGETGYLHQPEFTMLEWYRTNENYEKI